MKILLFVVSMVRDKHSVHKYIFMKVWYPYVEHFVNFSGWNLAPDVSDSPEKPPLRKDLAPGTQWQT
jgi:hypothetical protein